MGWVANRPGRLPPGKEPVPTVYGAGWAQRLVRTGVEYLAPTGIRSPDRPARSEYLYQLSYPSMSTFFIIQNCNNFAAVCTQFSVFCWREMKSVEVLNTFQYPDFFFSEDLILIVGKS
jgi:hypothetical protein